jgi:deoxyribonuclease V
MLESILSHPWCLSVGEAETLQARFAGLVEKSDRLPSTIGRVAGADVAYEAGGDRLFTAVVTQDLETLATLETGTHEDLACVPYMPGLFSFREIPPLARALAKLAHAPDLLICDSQGLAHPRRFGLACDLGVLLDIPTIGCAKSCLIGQYESPGDRPGETILFWSTRVKRSAPFYEPETRRNPFSYPSVTESPCPPPARGYCGCALATGSRNLYVRPTSWRIV